MGDIVERLVRFADKVCLSTDTEVEAADTIEALRAENARLREALKNARADALKEGAEIAFAYNGMPRSEIAQAFARAAMGESDD